MKVQLLSYAETNRRPWAEQVARGARCLCVEVADDATVEEMMAQMSKGSSRSGVFEIHTPDGIWHHHRPDFVERGYGRLDPKRAKFTRWEHLSV